MQKNKPAVPQIGCFCVYVYMTNKYICIFASDVDFHALYSYAFFIEA